MIKSSLGKANSIAMALNFFRQESKTRITRMSRHSSRRESSLTTFNDASVRASTLLLPDHQNHCPKYTSCISHSYSVNGTRQLSHMFLKGYEVWISSDERRLSEYCVQREGSYGKTIACFIPSEADKVSFSSFVSSTDTCREQTKALTAISIELRD